MGHEMTQWEIVTQTMPVCVRQMDPAGRSAWRLISKETRDFMFDTTTALSPSTSALLSITALPLPLLQKCANVKRLSCSGLRTLKTIEDLPPRLKALDISGTSVSDLSPLLHCTALVQLSAAGMKGVFIFRRVSSVLQQLPTLQRLDLSNNINNKRECLPAMRNLAPALLHLTGLVQLVFSSNNLGEEGAAALAPALYHLTGLKHLDLGGNRMGTEGMQALAPAIQSLTQLQQLHLGFKAEDIDHVQGLHRKEIDFHNAIVNLRGHHGETAAQMQMSSLSEQFGLALARAADADASACWKLLRQDAQQLQASIPEQGPEHHQLHHIAADLLIQEMDNLRQQLKEDRRVRAFHEEARVDVGVEGARALAAALQHLTGLKRLDLGGVSLGDEGAHVLDPVLCQLTRLKELDVRGSMQPLETLHGYSFYCRET